MACPVQECLLLHTRRPHTPLLMVALLRQTPPVLPLLPACPKVSRLALLPMLLRLPLPFLLLLLLLLLPLPHLFVHPSRPLRQPPHQLPLEQAWCSILLPL